MESHQAHNDDVNFPNSNFYLKALHFSLATNSCLYEVIAWLCSFSRRHPLNTEAWLTLVCQLHHSFFQTKIALHEKSWLHSFNWVTTHTGVFFEMSILSCFMSISYFVTQNIKKTSTWGLTFNKNNFYSSRHFYVKLGFLLVWFAVNGYVAMKNITPWCLSWCQHKVPAISPTIANVNTVKEGKNVLVLLSKLSDFVQPQEEVLGTEGDAQSILLEPWMYKFTSKLLGLCIKTVHVFPLPASPVHFHPSPSIHTPYPLIPNSLHVFCFCIFPHVAPSA